MKRPRFEVLKMKVRRGSRGSSEEVVRRLNKLKSYQRVVYLKHNTLINDRVHWTAIIENVSRAESVSRESAGQREAGVHSSARDSISNSRRSA